MTDLKVERVFDALTEQLKAIEGSVFEPPDHDRNWPLGCSCSCCEFSRDWLLDPEGWA